MLWIVVNGRKWLEGIRATITVIMMPRAEYELHFLVQAHPGWPGITTIKLSLFSFCFVVFRHDENLPQHLRQFTAGAVYVRILTYGVEVLQFMKRYSEAVNQLEQLIGQHVYQLDYRGRWYDRLALNLDYHVKQPLKVLSPFLFFFTFSPYLCSQLQFLQLMSPPL